MDINNILNKIESYKTKTAEKAEQERIAAETYRQSLYYKVWAIKPAINDLITVAKAAQEAGIPLRSGYMIDHTYANGDFFADASTHKVGFAPSSLISREIIGVGFEGGGCCGQYDFFTDGSTICDKDRDDGRETREASVEHLEKFIAKFPEFEKEFYAYIKKRTNCEVIVKPKYYIEVCDYNGEKVLESRWFNSETEAEDWWNKLGYFASGDYNAKILAAKSVDGRTIYGEDDDYDAEFVKYL